MFARAKMSARAFPFLCCPLISLPLPFLSHPTPDPDLDPSHPDPRASTGHLRQSNPRPPTRPWPMPGPVVFQHVPLAITSLRATFRVGPGQFLESKITQNCSCAKRSFQELPWIQNPPRNHVIARNAKNSSRTNRYFPIFQESPWNAILKMAPATTRLPEMKNNGSRLQIVERVDAMLFDLGPVDA